MRAPSATPGSHPGRFLQFAEFCCVGGVGFCIDAGLLLLLVHTGTCGPVTARFFSFSAAVLATFELNRAWTFRGAVPRQSRLSAMIGYFGVQGIGFVCNLVFYLIFLNLLPSPFDTPLICLFLAAAVAVIVNFFGASALVFRRKTT